MTSPDDALASLRERPPSTAAVDRPRRLTLNDSGHPLHIALPGPRVLASAWARDVLGASVGDLWRSGQTILSRPHGASTTPTPVALVDLRDTLISAARALPERPDASSGYYRSLRRLVEHGSAAAVASYLDDVLRSVRVLLPAWKPTKSPGTRRPPMTPAERKTATLAKRRSEYRAGRDYDLDDVRPVVAKWAARLAPGRHDLPGVWAAWQDALDRLSPERRQALEDADSPVLRLGRTGFYRLLAEIFEVKHGRARTRYFDIAEPVTEETPVYDEIRAETETLREANEEIERHIRLVAALHEQRDRIGGARTVEPTAATGDAEVVDLATRRARKSA